ncbi:MAG: dihydrolipoamide acetyltransferase family protein [Pseudomonadota bacterium]
MVINVAMPKLGMTMEQGKIIEWKKKEGEKVQAGEIIMIIETEKVTYEVESPGTGILHIIVEEGAEVPVGEVVGVLAVDQAEYDTMVTGKVVGAVSAAAFQEAPVSQEQAAPVVSISERRPAEKVRISPIARKLAEEKGFDISLIPGTGPEGRITREDVLNYEKMQTAPAPKKEAEVKIPPSVPVEEKKVIIKRTGMRKIIAQKMLQSKVEAAQTYMSNKVDATAVLEFRKQLLPYAEKKANVRVTITDILMKITAFALKEHPIMNSRYTEQGDLVIKDIHMGMAMALPEGLIVPVIWNIDKKFIIEVAKERVSLIERGRKGKLTPDDIKGSTFTFSALGMYGIEEFTAIINQPENAILAVAAIMDKPWVVNGQIVIRPIMNVNLTYDHRTIYGADAAKFMATLKMFIENPLLVLA